MRVRVVMGIALALLVLPAAAALLTAPEAATATFVCLTLGLGIALHAVLPPPSEEVMDAVLLSSWTAM